MFHQVGFVLKEVNAGVKKVKHFSLEFIMQRRQALDE
jgi:hypothetical protein